MKAKVLKDATLTVKAGQTVELDEKQFALAFRNGFVAPVEDSKPTKTTKKK